MKSRERAWQGRRAGVEGATSATVKVGGGCWAKSRLSRMIRSCRSGADRAYRVSCNWRPSVVGMWMSVIWMAVNFFPQCHLHRRNGRSAHVQGRGRLPRGRLLPRQGSRPPLHEGQIPPGFTVMATKRRAGVSPEAYRSVAFRTSNRIAMSRSFADCFRVS